MPPPRPRGTSYSTGVSNAPMSERQQMALLIQMTATSSSDVPRGAHLKKPDSKKADDTDEMSCGPAKSDGADARSKSTESTESENKKDNNATVTDHTPTASDVTSSGVSKRSFSDIDEDIDNDGDDLKKKKRKDSDSGKETKPVATARLPIRGVEKTVKQTNVGKSSPTTNKNPISVNIEKEAPDNSGGTNTASNNSSGSGSGSNKVLNQSKTPVSTTISAVAPETETDDDELKSSENFNSLKVPPLKIVIPQQNCTIDTDGNVSRTGKVSTSRSAAALPYVVSSNSDSNDRETVATAAQCNSPHESPVKVNNTIGTVIDEKNMKLLNEDKNLHRVLRSSYRTGGGAGGGHERSSNNSSPQLQSNSPSPASSSNANETTNDTKVNFSNMTTTTSPSSQQTHYDHEPIVNLPSPSTSSTSSSKEAQATVDLHPRKRKIRSKHEDNNSANAVKPTAHTPAASGTPAAGNDMTTAPASNASATGAAGDTHPHDFPFTNCFQMYLNIRRQVENKWRSLYPVKPQPPQGYHEYLINKKTYLLTGKRQAASSLTVAAAGATPYVPSTVPQKMREIFIIQANERTELTQRHIVEREKLCLNVEQEIIRVHSKAARNSSCQSAPFSVCTLLKDEEVYNLITPEQEEKDRSARYRCNGRLLLSWLQDVDDKWEKIKEAMVLRHHNEAESLHAVQLMDWEIALKRYELCDFKIQSDIDKDHVPIVHVSEDFDLLPA